MAKDEEWEARREKKRAEVLCINVHERKWTDLLPDA